MSVLMIDSRGHVFVAPAHSRPSLHQAEAPYHAHWHAPRPCCVHHLAADVRRGYYYEPSPDHVTRPHCAADLQPAHFAAAVDHHHHQSQQQQRTAAAARQVQTWWRHAHVARVQRAQAHAKAAQEDRAARVIVSAVRRKAAHARAIRELTSARELRAILSDAKALKAQHGRAGMLPESNNNHHHGHGNAAADKLPLAYTHGLDNIIARVDRVSTHGSEAIRELRRHIVRFAQGLIDDAERRRTAEAKSQAERVADSTHDAQGTSAPAAPRVSGHAGAHHHHSQQQQQQGQSMEAPARPPTMQAAGAQVRRIPVRFAANTAERQQAPPSSQAAGPHSCCGRSQLVRPPTPTPDRDRPTTTATTTAPAAKGSQEAEGPRAAPLADGELDGEELRRHLLGTLYGIYSAAAQQEQQQQQAASRPSPSAFPSSSTSTAPPRTQAAPSAGTATPAHQGPGLRASPRGRHHGHDQYGQQRAQPPMSPTGFAFGAVPRERGSQHRPHYHHPATRAAAAECRYGLRNQAQHPILHPHHRRHQEQAQRGYPPHARWILGF